MERVILRHIFLCLCLIPIFSCEDQLFDFEIYGTWIQKNPELYDGISDTLEFNKDGIVNKHFFFEGYEFMLTKDRDSIIFYSDADQNSYSIRIISDHEVVFENFIERLLTNQVRDISYIRIKE